jgi:hypothetical protein
MARGRETYLQRPTLSLLRRVAVEGNQEMAVPDQLIERKLRPQFPLLRALASFLSFNNNNRHGFLKNPSLHRPNART